MIQSLEAPEPNFLDRYYSDATTTRSTAKHAVITPGFDVAARTSLLDRYHRGGILVEIGAGDGTFCEILRQSGLKAIGFDPLGTNDSSAVKLGYASIENIGENSASTVVAYHVLEHAADPMNWLQSVTQILKPNGTIIIEVPDVERWPIDAWHHEHFTQFANKSLQTLLEQAGFETITCGLENPSRHHGTVYIGRYIGAVPPLPRLNREESHQAIENAFGLYARADRLRHDQQAAATKTAERAIRAMQLSSRKCEVIVWGANEIATAIGRSLRRASQTLTVRIVDNSDSKAGLPHTGFDSVIERPVFSDGSQNDLIFILCSRNWNQQIAHQIKALDIKAVQIIDGTDWPVS